MSEEITLEILKDNRETGELGEFIENSLNGTIFHRPKFLSYHEDGKIKRSSASLHHLIFRKKNRIIAFLPGAICKNKEALIFNSPWGASFGGIVTDMMSFGQCERVLDKTLNHLLLEEKVKEINITPATNVYMGDRADDYFAYLYSSKGFKLNKSELTVVTRISSKSDFPKNVFKDRVKSSVNQSKKKGVTCKITEDADLAYPIIEEDQKKFNKKPTHTLRELKTIAKLFPGRILQFIAFKNEKPIAVVTLFLCNSRTAFTFYIDQLEEHGTSRPLDLLLSEVITWLKEKGYGYLDFGPSSFGYEPHKSLIFFKEGFGGRGIVKNFYQYSKK